MKEYFEWRLKDRSTNEEFAWGSAISMEDALKEMNDYVSSSLKEDPENSIICDVYKVTLLQSFVVKNR